MPVENCHPRYSCSKLLLIDAIFIRFSDRMLFTFSHKNDVQSVANGNRRRIEVELRQCDIR